MRANYFIHKEMQLITIFNYNVLDWNTKPVGIGLLIKN